MTTATEMSLWSERSGSDHQPRNPGKRPTLCTSTVGSQRPRVSHCGSDNTYQAPTRPCPTAAADGQVAAQVIDRAYPPTLHKGVTDHRQPDARLYADTWIGYNGLPNRTPVRHHVGQYVLGMAHTNGKQSS